MEANENRIGLSFLQRLPLAQSRRWIAYGFALAISVAATWLRFEVDPLLPPGFPFLTFFPAVILTAFLFGLGPGIVSAVLCGLAALYWFIPPVGLAFSYNSAVALAFYIVIVTVDILLVHWMQRANAHLVDARSRANQLAATRETLFRELQHRVGNNLQMVASLLALQKRDVTEPAALNAIGEASRRVALVGRIQRTLYSSEGEQLALEPYLEAIIRDTVEASGRKDVTVEFDGAALGSMIEPNTAIPAALVVAEAVSNALEHGFAEQGGTIRVSAALEEGVHVVTIRDDGKGLPEGFDAEKSSSLGLRIARNLSRTLGGGFTVRPCEYGGGTCAILRMARL